MKKFFIFLVSLILIFSSALPLAGCVQYVPTEKIVTEREVCYFLGDEFFSFKGYTFNNSQEDSKYYLRVSFSCEYNLSQYSAEVKIYNLNGELVFSDTLVKEESVVKNSDNTLSFELNGNCQEVADKVDVYFSGLSSEKPSSFGKEFTVTFAFNNGESDLQVAVEKNKSVFMPSDPEKENYIFIGWYEDSAFNKKYDFSSKVTGNLTLYANYVLDATKLTNKISTDTIKGIVKIYNKSYNTGAFGKETSYAISQGSGFCFAINNGNYYILTNCHVAQKNNSYSYQKITIEDYKGNSYDGYIYQKQNINAIASAYDLACIYFTSSSTEVKEIPLLSQDPAIGEDVIALGAPEGQTNTVTYGKIKKYGKITISDTPEYLSNVTFSVIEHTAYTNHGSSGGPLLNADLKVIGVNFAISVSSGTGHSVSASKVCEFLSEYVYS